MSDTNKCPQCGAVMEVKAVGLMHDKVMSCSYCGHVIDIPDDYQESKIVEEVSPDGTRRRIHMERKRIDASPDRQGQAKRVVTNYTVQTNMKSSEHVFTFDPKTRTFKQGKSSGGKFKESGFSGQDRDLLNEVMPPELLEEFKARAEDPNNSKAEEDRQIYQIMKDVADGKTPIRESKSVHYIYPGRPGDVNYKVALKGNATFTKSLFTEGPETVVTPGKVKNLKPAEQSTTMTILKWVGIIAVIWVAAKIVLTLILRIHF